MYSKVGEKKGRSGIVTHGLEDLRRGSYGARGVWALLV